ncbi:Capsular biosynthesis protein [Bordetella sputigena]|uniref:glycosyltransferase family 61 protein n=1 Tax=Bordetella sputigena TaxID=1416810 RepID=UPI0039EF0BC1
MESAIPKMKNMLMRVPGVRRAVVAHRRVRKLRALTASGLFDADWYVERYKLNGMKDPAAHYLSIGGFAGLNPNPLFHSEWYLLRYPDVRNAAINPLLHYIWHGAAQNRKPNALFDATWYLDRYADVKDSRIDPLVHYLSQGGKERRDPNPLFDADWYVRRYLPGGGGDVNPLVHYMETGALRGDNPHPLFDCGWYLKKYMSRGGNCVDALAYFLETGWAKGDLPGPLFNPSWYLEEYPDVAASGQDALYHYVRHGRAEGRLPNCSPHYFKSAAALRAYLSALPPALESTRVTVELPVASVQESVAGSTAMVSDAEGTSIIYSSSTISAVGVEQCDYPTPPYVAKINNALALGGTRYVVAGAHLLHDEERRFFNEQGSEIKYIGARRLKAGSIRLDLNLRQGAWVGSGINLMHEYSNNYFHFVVETLPRILLAEEATIRKDVPLLMESNLHDNMRTLVDAVNGDRRPVMWLESGVAHHIREMYMPADASVVVDAYYGGPVARRSAIDVGRIRQAVERCKRVYAVQGANPRRNIYACRRGRTRQLLNQAELEAKLAALGFEIVCVDDMSLETQVRIFSEARTVIAPTGAQVTNIIWCDPGTNVVVLASDHPSHQLYLWELLGQVSYADVEVLLGPRAYVRDDKYSVHDDYHIDVDAVLRAIG